MLLEQVGETHTANAASGISTQRIYFAPILSVALLLRTAMALIMIKPGTNLWFYNQASELGCLAQSMENGHGLASPFCGVTGPSAFLAPGYPLLVAFAFHYFGDYSIGATAMLVACQIIFGILLVLSIMLVARTIFGARIAHATGFICAVSPTLIWLPVLFWETSFTMLSLTGTMALALYCCKKPRRSNWMWLGACCGTSMLVNPALMFTLLAIVAWAIHRVQPHSCRAALLIFVAWISAFAVWPIRNEVALHAFVPLRTNLGYELWQGNRPGSNGEFTAELHPNVSRIERSRYVQVGEMAYMREKSALAISAIKADPTRFALLSLRRTIRFWLGLASKQNSTLVILDLSTTSLLAVAGLVLLRQRERAYAVLLAAPLLLFPLPYYVTHADFRFRLVLDPLAILLTASAVQRLYRLARRNHTSTGSFDDAPEPLSA